MRYLGFQLQLMETKVNPSDLDDAFGETDNLIEPTVTIATAVTARIRDATKGMKVNLCEERAPPPMASDWRGHGGETVPEAGQTAETSACVELSTSKFIDTIDRSAVNRWAHWLFLAFPSTAAEKSDQSTVGLRDKFTPKGRQQRTGLKPWFANGRK
jgi:hypothetical protein